MASMAKAGLFGVLAAVGIIIVGVVLTPLIPVLGTTGLMEAVGILGGGAFGYSTYENDTKVEAASVKKK